MNSLRLTVFFALIVILLVAVNPISADLVAHWTANGTSLDSSGNGHHATWSGSADYGVGHLGQGFQFDGTNNYLSVAGNSALETAVISISLWFKTPDIAADRLLVDSYHGSTNGNQGWAIQMNGSSGRIGFAYGNGSSFPEIATPGSLEDDTFHHLVATLDATSTMRIYVDGVVGTPFAYSGTPMGTGDGLRFGRHFSLNRQFTGILDDIRIYNHALDQGEVNNLFNAIPEPTGLVATICLILGLIGNRRVRCE